MSLEDDKVCFKLNNTVRIQNDESGNPFYIFNDDFYTGISGEYTSLKYRRYLSETGSTEYTIKNIPKLYPIGFYLENNKLSDGKYLNYNSSTSSIIKIYVSSGTDFVSSGTDLESANQYYRFYDESYNLINIHDNASNHSSNNSNIDIVGSTQFYFMLGKIYQFEAIQDFSNGYPFILTGIGDYANTDYSLNDVNDNFILDLSSNVFPMYDDLNCIIYSNDINNNPDNKLNLLLDGSGIGYFYGDITIRVYNDNDNWSGKNISIKSFSGEISQPDFFTYDDKCNYIVDNNIITSSNGHHECIKYVVEAKKLNNKENALKRLGIYDGVYTIYNVNPNNPITLRNNEATDRDSQIPLNSKIYVDENNTTGIIYKTDELMVSGEQYNYNYYFNTVRIIVKQTDAGIFQLRSGTLGEEKDIEILELDLSSGIVNKMNTCLHYTDDCSPDTINEDISFVLYNQVGKPFTHDFSYGENIYKLNLYEQYIEPDPPYRSFDKYINDISNLIITTIPSVIDYDLSSFLITYFLQDYESETRTLKRLVNIEKGPFIEILRADPIFDISNPKTNTLKLTAQPNIEISYNLYDNLDVYVYDNSRNKIELPFEISISGEYRNLSDDTSYSDVSHAFKYNNTKYEDYNYYLSKHLITNLKENLNVVNSDGIKIQNVSSFNISYLDSENENLILRETNFLNFESTTTGTTGTTGTTANKNYWDFVEIKRAFSSFFLDGTTVSIDSIDSSNNTITITQEYKNTVLKTTLRITNTDFTITMKNKDENDVYLIVDGSLVEIDIFGFDDSQIDPTLVGDYELTVQVKGLGDDDSIYNDISNLLDVSNLNRSLSRTFMVNIIHPTPTLRLSFGTRTLVLSSGETFDISNHIKLLPESDTDSSYSNIPVLYYANSRYEPVLIGSGHYPESPKPEITFHYVNEITESNKVTFDICYINDFPIIELVDGNKKQLDNDTEDYQDPGIIIDGARYDFSYEIQGFYYNGVPFTLTSESSRSHLPQTGDIYYIRYIVEKSSTDVSKTLIRIVEKVDDKKPIFKLVDISNSDIISVLSEQQREARLTDASSIIDFSFNLNSSVDNLFSIIKEISFNDTVVRVDVTLKIKNYDVSFSENGLGSSDYLDNNKFKELIDLDFTYEAVGTNGMKTFKSRSVKIVDTQPPEISFSFNFFSARFVEFAYVSFPTNTNTPDKDFSYHAIDFKRDPSGIRFELNSILFDYYIEDNYDNDISSTITISGTTIFQAGIDNINDISDNILALFSTTETKNLSIKYYVEDNQGNSNTILRKVDIIDNSKPEISIKSDVDSSNIEILFGNTNFRLNNYLESSHNRRDPNSFVYTISGGITERDLIYYEPDTVHEISVYSKSDTGVSSEVIDINIFIRNEGPIFDDISYTIYHEAGNLLSDASLILGVNAVSSYDKYYLSSQDISYLFTRFNTAITSSDSNNNIDLENPKVGIHTVEYSAEDIKGKKNVMTRQLIIEDTTGPIINVNVVEDIYHEYNNDAIKILRFEEFIVPSASFRDAGSDLKSIDIYIQDSNQEKFDIFSEVNLESQTYDFSNSGVILSREKTRNINISYELFYKATDIHDNSNTKIITIEIIQETKFIIEPKVSFMGNDFSLNSNFNDIFNQTIRNTDNLQSYDISLNYNSSTKTITYQLLEILEVDLLQFAMSATYDTSNVAVDNNTVTNNIVFDVTGEYKILFQSYYVDNGTFESFLEVINFNIVNNILPVLSFILSPDYPNIDYIELPLISNDVRTKLSNDLFYLENASLSNPNLFAKNDSGDIIYSIPGINITGPFISTFSLINENLDSITGSRVTQKITYTGNSIDNYIGEIESRRGQDQNEITIDLSHVYTENSKIVVSLMAPAPRQVGTPRRSLCARAEITFKYHDKTVHKLRFEPDMFIRFLDGSNTNIAAGENPAFGLGRLFVDISRGGQDVKWDAEERGNIIQKNNNVFYHASHGSRAARQGEKQYEIEIKTPEEKRVFKFEALTSGVKKVDILIINNEEIDDLFLFQDIRVKSIPLFDISNTYLTYLDQEEYFEQTYTVSTILDNKTNSISRNIHIKEFSDFIKLTYPEDSCGNRFYKIYHQQYKPYQDLLGELANYRDGVKSPTLYNISIQKTIDENVLGIQEVEFMADDNYSTTATRDVHVVSITCLPLEINDFNDFIQSNININHKIGLYKGVYKINIGDSSNAIRLVGSNYNNDISGMIDMSGGNIEKHQGYNYYWGVFELVVTSDFNRASLEYFTSDSSKVLLEDVFLYTDECERFTVQQISTNGLLSKTFDLDVSGYNSLDNSGQYFTLSGEIYSADTTSVVLSRANLHLPMGKYTFNQGSHRNFYNRIKFSITEDGTHNNGVEFTKGITDYGMSGLNNGRTELILSATTPSPLYYYSKNFPNMGGKIETRNNIVFSGGNIYLTDNVLSPNNVEDTSQITGDTHKLLVSRKLETGEDGKRVNVNCLTQQKIRDNVLLDNSRNLIIFKKSTESSEYLSRNYLFDVSANMSQTNILMYDCKIDSSRNLLSSYSSNRDMDNPRYEINPLLYLFRDNDVMEINNYYNYFKNNKLLETRFLKKNFISKINEIKYNKPTSIMDGNEVYDYYLDKYLSSGRIIFSDIIDNEITFIYQTHIDLSNLYIPRKSIDYLSNNVFTKHKTPSKYPLDNSNVLFEEYTVNILCDISDNNVDVNPGTEEENILLSNGSIELNAYLLNSADSSGILYNVHENSQNDVDEELKNMVFLSLRDISMTNGVDNQYIGITLQNIYHNIYINDDNVFIFHSYEVYNNFNVNETTSNLETTKTGFSNNNKYLIEISDNDLYGCFFDDWKKDITTYNNNSNKDFKFIVSYFINDELDISSNYLENFDIRPQTPNDVINNPADIKMSHSYIIDLNDYFYRNIYQNSDAIIPINIYNKNNLKYTIKSLGYINKEFNIFDVEGNQNIIYDKSKVDSLNYTQNRLLILNFRVDFIWDIISNKLLYHDASNSYYPEQYQFKNNTTSIQYLTDKYSTARNTRIPNVYELDLETDSLNNLYSNNFHNSKQLKEKCKLIKSIFLFHQNHEYINEAFPDNIYNDLTHFTNVEQLLTDASAIVLDISYINNTFNYYYSSDSSDSSGILNLLKTKTGSYRKISNTSDYDILENALFKYTTMKQTYDNIIFELNERHLNRSLFADVSYIDVSYTDVYNKINIDNFIDALFDNYHYFNKALKVQINQSIIEIAMEGDSKNNMSYTDNEYGEKSIDKLTNVFQTTETNFGYFLTAISGIYDFTNKERVYNKMNDYHMGGSKLLINSFYSNNLQFEIDLGYTSHLYSDTHIDTFVLDLAIPDYIAPTLLFHGDSLSFSQGLSTGDKMSELKNILLGDISFIDVNQLDTYYVRIIYNDISNIAYEKSDYLDENNSSSEYTTLDIDVRSMYNQTLTFDSYIDIEGTKKYRKKSIDISYTVTDNVNNHKTEVRTVTIQTCFRDPTFHNTFDGKQLTTWSYIVNQGVEITNENILKGIVAKDDYDENLPITVTNNLTNTDTPGFYNIQLTATSKKGYDGNFETTINGEIQVKQHDGSPPINVNCPCPIYYNEIQNVYRMGSDNSTVKKLAKIISRNKQLY